MLFKLPRSTKYVSIDKHGIEFPYVGDVVIWTWWWRRRGEPKYISLGFSGNGSFGDARYPSLRALREEWADYERSVK